MIENLLLRFIVLALSGLIIHGAILAIYRLLLHPLASFPGPKLAAATYWTSFYDDVLSGPYPGREWNTINELHKRYGPIVRVSPDELHVDDPEWFDTLYNKGRKEKWPRNHKANGSPGSIAQTVSREVHRARRLPLQPFFSKQAIISLEGSIKEKVQKLCSKIEQNYAKTGTILPIGTPFTALTLDVITEYCFGQCWDTLDQPGFSQGWKDTMTNLFEPVPIVKQFPWLLQMILLIPPHVVFKFDKDMARGPMAKAATLASVKSLLAEHNDPSKVSEKGSGRKSRDNIFTTILKSDLPQSEKTAERLNDEGFVMVVAGAETTARALTYVIYYLHCHPEWLAKVRAEVDQVMPNSELPSSSEIERKCPTLIASVKETLRLWPGVTNRLQLYDAQSPMRYKDWVIPVGTPVSMSSVQIHHNPDIFENPSEFNPGRWLGDDAERLSHFYVPFLKGTRSCIGLNLAYVEIYLTLAALLRSFDLDLYDVDKARDIDVVRDCFIGLPSPQARPLRVKMNNRISA